MVLIDNDALLFPDARYVGNLDARVSEELLLTLFGTLGQCKACKIIKEVSYNFIKFYHIYCIKIFYFYVIFNIYLIRIRISHK